MIKHLHLFVYFTWALWRDLPAPENTWKAALNQRVLKRCFRFLQLLGQVRLHTINILIICLIKYADTPSTRMSNKYTFPQTVAWILKLFYLLMCLSFEGSQSCSSHYYKVNQIRERRRGGFTWQKKALHVNLKFFTNLTQTFCFSVLYKIS